MGTARHLQDFFKDTLVNPLPYKSKNGAKKICSVLLILLFNSIVTQEFSRITKAEQIVT